MRKKLTIRKVTRTLISRMEKNIYVKYTTFRREKSGKNIF